MISDRTVHKHEIHALMCQLFQSRIKPRFILYDEITGNLALHSQNMVTAGQLLAATGRNWNAFKGKQQNIPFIKNASNHGRLQKLVFFKVESEKVIQQAAKIEQLEAHIKKLDVSVTNAHEENVLLRTQLSDYARSALMETPTNKFDKTSAYVGLSGDEEGSPVRDDVERSPVRDDEEVAVPLPCLAQAFRFATVEEVCNRSNLVGMSVLYLWPEMGWLKGKVVSRISRSGFTHRVRYGRSSSTWEHGAIVDTLLSIEWYTSRWMLLIPQKATEKKSVRGRR